MFFFLHFFGFLTRYVKIRLHIKTTKIPVEKQERSLPRYRFNYIQAQVYDSLVAILTEELPDLTATNNLTLIER